MKICFLTTVPETLKSFVIEQAKYIHSKHPDWEITFICDKNEDFARSLDEYIRYIPVSMNRGVDIKGIKTVFDLKKLFQKEKFDMIIYATPNAALYASLAGKMAHIKKRLYCQWGIRYVGFSGIKRKIFKILEKVTCANSTYVNAVSIKNRQFAIDEKLYKADKATVVGNGGTIGVNLSAYNIKMYNEYRKEKREELEINDEFVFGFVGRLSRDKGAFELLSAVRHLSEEKIRLVCIGSDELSDNDIPSELKAWARENGRIIFVGEKNESEVIKYYAAMDAYVHPTYREGFGMVLQEAGAMGCPVITTDIPGAGEVLVNGESCLLVKLKDVEELVTAMKKLYEDREFSKKLGENARRYVEEKYERNSMLSNQLKRYEDILGECEK